MNLSKLIRNERAQGLVEFALTILLFLMLMMMIIELGRIMFAMVTLQAGVRAGARYAVTGDWMSEYGLDPEYGWTAGSSDPMQQIAPCWPLFTDDPVVDGTLREPEYNYEAFQPYRNARTCSVEHQVLGRLSSLQLNPQASDAADEANSYLVMVSGMGVLPEAGDTFDIPGHGADIQYDSGMRYSTDYLDTNTGYRMLRGYAGLPQQKVVVQAAYRIPMLTPLLSAIVPSIRLEAQAVMTNEAFGSTGLQREAILPPELGDVDPLISFDPADLVITTFENTNPDPWDSIVSGDDLFVDIVVENQGQQIAYPSSGNTIDVCLYATNEEPSTPADIVSLGLTPVDCQSAAVDEQIANGGTRTYTTVGGQISGNGVVYIYAWVDSGEVVDESLDDNNITYLGDVFLGEAADLFFTDIDPAVVSDTPADGETFTYTMRVENAAGYSEAQDVEVVVSLPSADFTFDSPPANCTTAGLTATCDLGAIAESSGVDLSLSITVAPGTAAGTYEISASTSTATFENILTNNDTAADVAVNGTDLSILKEIDDDEPDVGQTVNYTITVTNNGDNPVPASTTVMVTDVLPANLNFVSAVGDGSYNDGTGEWTISSGIPYPGSVQMVISAEILDATLMTNVATITAGPPDPNPVNDSSTDETAPYEVDLAVEITDAPAQGAPGDDVVYEVTLTNLSSQYDAHALVTITVSGGLLTPFNYSASTGTVFADVWEFDIGMLDTETLTMTATVDAFTGTPPDVVFTVELTDSTPGDNNAANNSDTTTFTVSDKLDLRFTSNSSVTPETAPAGTTLTYTYEIINDGPGTASDVEVTSALPSDILDELTLTDIDGDGTFNQSTGAWVIGDLPEGETRTLTVSGTVKGRTSDETFSNTATITLFSPIDFDLTNNEFDSEVTLTPLTYAYNLAEVDGAASCDDDKVWGANSSLGKDYTWVEIPSSILNGTYDSEGNYQGTIRYPNGTILNQAGQDLFNCRVYGYDFRLDFTDLDEGTWTVTLLMVEDWYTAREFDVSFTTAYTSPPPPVLDDHSIYNEVGIDRVEIVTFEGVQVGDDNSLTIDFDTVTGHAMINAVLLEYEDAPAQVADLAVEKLLVDPGTGNPIAGPVYPGQNIWFTVNVENLGPNKASGVSVFDEIPTGIIFNSAVADKGSYDDGTGIWSIGTIEDGVNYTLTIDATIDPTISAPSDLYNTASIATTLQTNPTSPGPNSASVLVEVDPPNANIEVTQVGTSSAFPGETATFTVTATNLGPNDATNVQIEDLLGDGLTFVSATPSNGTVTVTEIPGAADQIVWDIPALAAVVSETLTIQATVDLTYTDYATPIDNIATRTASTPGDLDAGNDSATISLSVSDPRIDLRLEKSVTPDAPSQGAAFTYTLTLYNDAPDMAATGIVVTDTLPGDISVTGSNPSVGSYAGGVWDGFSLNPGMSATLEIYADVTAPTGTVITNTAEVTAANETDVDSVPGDGTGDDYATVDFTVSPPITDLALTLTADDETPTVYDDVVFTIIVNEQNVGAASNVEVTLYLPAGLTYEGDTGTCTNAAGTVTCDLGAIAQNGSAGVTVTASVDEDEDGSNLAVAAEVTALDQTDSDSTPGDGTGDDYDSVTVVPHPNFLFINVGPDDWWNTCGDRVFGTTQMAGHWGLVNPADWEILGRRDATFYAMDTTAEGGLDWISSVTFGDDDALNSWDQTLRFPDNTGVPDDSDADRLYYCREDRDMLQIYFNDLEPGTYRLYYMSFLWRTNYGQWDVEYRIGWGAWTTWLNNYNPEDDEGRYVMDVEISNDIVLSSTDDITLIIDPDNGDGMTSAIGIERLP